jgi:hypothetical protein
LSGGIRQSPTHHISTVDHEVVKESPKRRPKGQEVYVWTPENGTARVFSQEEIMRTIL